MALEIKIEKEEKEYPEFDIPEGLNLSDLTEGDEKEVLAKVRMKKDGRACIVSIDGIALGEPEDEEYEEEEVEDVEDPDVVGGTILARARQGGIA